MRERMDHEIMPIQISLRDGTLGGAPSCAHRRACVKSRARNEPRMHNATRPLWRRIQRDRSLRTSDMAWTLVPHAPPPRVCAIGARTPRMSTTCAIGARHGGGARSAGGADHSRAISNMPRKHRHVRIIRRDGSVMASKRCTNSLGITSPNAQAHGLILSSPRHGADTLLDSSNCMSCNHGMLDQASHPCGAGSDAT